MAACSIGYKCICCGISVERGDSRRKVCEPFLLPFEDFVQQALPRMNYLPTDHSKLFWCRKCFARLEKVTKLRKEVKRLDNEIVNDISSFGKKLGLKIEAEENGSVAEENETVAEARTETEVNEATAHETLEAIPPVTENPKRRLVWLTENQPRQKRRKLHTPENETLANTIVTDTPNISVSS